MIIMSSSKCRGYRFLCVVKHSAQQFNKCRQREIDMILVNLDKDILPQIISILPKRSAAEEANVWQAELHYGKPSVVRIW